MSSSQTSVLRSLFPNSKTFLCAGPPGLGGKGVTGTQGKQGPPGPPGTSDTYQVPNLFGIEFSTSSDNSGINVQLLNASASLGTTVPNFVGETTIALASLPGFSTLPTPIMIETFNLEAFGFNIGSLFSTAPIQIKGNVIPSLRQQYTVENVNTTTTPFNVATYLPAGSQSTIAPSGVPSTVTIPVTTVGGNSVTSGTSQTYTIIGPDSHFYGTGTIITATSGTQSTYIVDFTYASNSLMRDGTTSVGVTFPVISSTSGLTLTNVSAMLYLDFVNVTAQGLTSTTITANPLLPKMVPTSTQVNVAAPTKNLVLVLTDSQHGIYSQVQITNGASFSTAAGTGLGLPISQSFFESKGAIIPYRFYALVGLHQSQTSNYKLVLNFAADNGTPRVASASLSPNADGSSSVSGTVVSAPVIAPTVMSPWQSTGTGTATVNDIITFTINGQKVVLHVSFTKIPVGYSSNKGVVAATNWAISVNGNVASDNANINILDIVMDGDAAHSSYSNTALFCLSSTDFGTVGSIDFNLIASQ